MNRAFKTVFHNGNADEKPIVTMSVTVNNGKRYKDLDEYGRQALWGNLNFFKHQLEAFMEEVKSSAVITTSNDLISK